MGNLIDDAGIDVLQEVADIVFQSAPFTLQSGMPSNPGTTAPLLRGYLMQPVSRGERALVALVSRRPEYRTFKIDLAGIIYYNYPDIDSKFQLRLKRNGATWFDTEPLTIENLSSVDIIKAISTASQSLTSRVQQTIQIPLNTMMGFLGHPTQHSLIQNNSDLYPEYPNPHDPLEWVDSKIGSWIISIHRSVLPPLDVDFDIELSFTVTGDELVQLVGPSVMTIREEKDMPNNSFIVATDVLDMVPATKLAGGSKVVVGNFEDVGYGIVSASPRPMFREQDYLSLI